jgi:DNA end-binding protein Ku
VPDDLDTARRKRRIWTGTISFGLVSIPVDLLPARRRGRPGLRTLAPDGTPLSREYFDPETGDAVESDALIRGYELSEGGFVTVEPDELKALAPERTRDIDLRLFVPEEQLDPFYYRSAYFLTPSAGSTKAYRLLARVMEDRRRAGIATFVMRDREYLVAILAEGAVLRAETLRFHDEIRPVTAIDLPERPPRDEDRIESLLETVRAHATESLDRELLRDEEGERLEELALRKREEGRDLVAAPDSEDAEEDADDGGDDVIDLMEVIRRSLADDSADPDVSAEPDEAADAPATAEMTRDELYERARELDVAGRSSMKKAELLEAIRAHG